MTFQFTNYKWKYKIVIYKQQHNICIEINNRHQNYSLPDSPGMQRHRLNSHISRRIFDSQIMWISCTSRGSNKIQGGSRSKDELNMNER